MTVQWDIGGAHYCIQNWRRGGGREGEGKKKEEGEKKREKYR